MKVAVYAIAKDEAKHVARWLKSCAGADVVLLVDTGSTDGTLDTLGEAAETSEVRDVRCVVANVVPWRFDDARNTALSLVPPDVDWCITLDLDEILTDGWREKFELAINQAPDAAWVRYGYIWNFREDGSPETVFRAHRTHRRRGFRWRYPCHETLQAYAFDPPVRADRYAEFDGTMIEHHADSSKSRADYLHLLELAVSENPTDRRCSFYFRREKLFRLHGETGGTGMSLAYLSFAREAWPDFPVEAKHAASEALKLARDASERAAAERFGIDSAT